jgi:SOS response regulatory protein OraA/RecX
MDYLNNSEDIIEEAIKYAKDSGYINDNKLEEFINIYFKG